MAAKNEKGNAALKLLVALVIVVVAAWLVLGQFRSTAIVATVERGDAVDIVTGSVTVHAEGNVKELKSEAAGRVEWCEALATGAVFKKGDELVRLDSSDLRRDIAQAETDFKTATDRNKIKMRDDPRLQVAQRTFDNATRSHDRHEISDVDFDTAKHAFEKTKTDVELDSFDIEQAKVTFENKQADSKRLLEKMTIRAPVDGIVRDSSVYPGAVISQGTTVATYYSRERFIEAKISEDSASKLAIGQRAKVRLLNLGSTEYDATVTKILPFADADTQRYTANLEIDPKVLAPEKLIPFGTGEVTITVAENKNSLLLPRRALFSGIDGYYVFVVKDGRVEKRKVKVGFVGLNKAEVKELLSAGETVIVSDLDQFRDGQRVRTESVKN
jgi:RND family efflux transporter MFP subunit